MIELTPEQAARMRSFAGGRDLTLRDNWESPDADALLRAGFLQIKYVAKASMTFEASAAGEAWLREHAPA